MPGAGCRVPGAGCRVPILHATTAIRMIPAATLFGRFPRLVRELGAKMGKRLELLTQGGSTELDKGMIEQIVDPLTHLVRNSCDHGIEAPAERRALGKPEIGTLRLSAAHQGGSIVIELRDDGRGLSRARLLVSARESGLRVPDSSSDADTWALIFAPGFSTAAQDDAVVMVVVEADGVRVALGVHELLGQQQVVVRNLEPNVGAVERVAGATTMGDGGVALILDVRALVREAAR